MCEHTRFSIIGEINTILFFFNMEIVHTLSILYRQVCIDTTADCGGLFSAQRF